jgi:hypothetical protein
MTAYLIPLQPFASQFTLSVGDADYGMRTYYREAPEAGWHMDLWDIVNDSWRINGIPFVTGLDLMIQYKFLLLGFQLWLIHDLGFDMPAYDELGSVARLYLVTPNG